MLDAEKMMTNFSEIKLLLCFPITFFFKVLKYQRNKHRCFFTALEHPQRGKKGVKFLWLLCYYSNSTYTLSCRKIMIYGLMKLLMVFPTNKQL